MNVTLRTCLLGCALAAAGTLPGLAGAQTQTTAKTYVITTSAQSSTGTVVVHEALSLERAGTGSWLQLASADGSVLSLPVTFTSEGEIASNSQDGAVTCYNMAINVLARVRRPSGEPASVFVRFGNSVVQIPLDVRATQTRGKIRDIALDGRSAGVFSTGDAAVDAGILIGATVEEVAGVLHLATFDELHYAGTPAHVIARSTCVLQRAERPATARV